MVTEPGTISPLVLGMIVIICCMAFIIWMLRDGDKEDKPPEEKKE
jgi:Ca2+/Na+ antiporter